MRQIISGASAVFFLLAVPSAALADDAAVPVPMPVSAIPASATPSASAPAFPGIVDIWTANEGAALSDTLASWSERAGWKLIWESDSDFRLAAGGQFEGDFQDASQRLIEAFGRTRPRLRASFYGGNTVLRVWAERAEP